MRDWIVLVVDAVLCAFRLVGLNFVSDCGTKIGATFGAVIVTAVAHMKTT